MIAYVNMLLVGRIPNALFRAGLIYKATLAYLQSHLQKKAPRIPTCKTYQAVTSRTSTCKFISAYFSLQELPGTLISKYSCHARLIHKPQRSSSSHSYVQPQITSNLSTDENEAANATKPIFFFFTPACFVALVPISSAYAE